MRFRPIGLIAFAAALTSGGALAQSNGGGGTTRAPIHVGIIGASGGDVESCAELAPFTINFTGTLAGASLPPALRVLIGQEIWAQAKTGLLAEYGTLPKCNTHFQSAGRAQTRAMADIVRQALPQAAVSSYAGFRYVYGVGVPVGLTLLDVLERAESDGVTNLFITDQDDIEFSTEMEQLGFAQIQSYLANHPEWQPTVIGFNGYSKQPGFAGLLVQDIRRDVAHEFPGVPASDVVVMLPCQGIDETTTNPDSQATLATALAQTVASALPEYSIQLAFQDWGVSTGTGTWSQPTDDTVLGQIAAGKRSHVLVSPKLQWPVTDISVLWRQPVYYSQTIAAADPTKTVASVKAWDSSPAFVQFAAAAIVDMVSNSAQSKYDVTVIQ